MPQHSRFVYKTGFAPVPYEAMRDTEISIEARGFLALMMTHSPEWKFNRNNMIKKCGCGKDKYDRMRKELVDAGYLRIRPSHDENGRVNGSIWQLSHDKSLREDSLEDGDYGSSGNPE